MGLFWWGPQFRFAFSVLLRSAEPAGKSTAMNSAHHERREHGTLFPLITEEEEGRLLGGMISESFRFCSIRFCLLLTRRHKNCSPSALHKSPPRTVRCGLKLSVESVIVLVVVHTRLQRRDEGIRRLGLLRHTRSCTISFRRSSMCGKAPHSFR